MAFNKLVWLITSYGLSRIAQAQSDPTVQLTIDTIKVGDANPTVDGTVKYYTPTASQTSLVNFKESFNITGVQLLTATTSTPAGVTFMTTIPETSGGYDIIEVGIFENVDGIENLFAIGVGEPLRKPTIAQNYIMSVNYNVDIFNENLASVYGQIALDPKSQFITSVEFDNLKLNVLFMENNLSQQISNNTAIIGLNGPAILTEQLNNEISVVNQYYSHNTMANIINCLSNPTDVLALWSFENLSSINKMQIQDFSDNDFYLSLNKSVASFKISNIGFSSFLDINSPDYFTLGSDVNFSFLNQSGTDSPISIISLIKHNNINSITTLLAKSDYSKKVHTFEVNKLSEQLHNWS